MSITSSMAGAEALRGIPSVPESAISGELAAGLPAPVPAPWTTSGSGLMWLQRAAANADRFQQPGLSYDRALPLTVAAFLRYEEGPVGAYDELIAMPNVVLRRRRLSLAVPFIAVDSEASIAGGRANWALPKTLAEFEWLQHSGLVRQIEARGDGWSAEARVLWSGPRMPLWARVQQTQVRADGSMIGVPIRSVGIGRAARVEVHTEGPTLPHWLTSGVHMGVAIERVKHRILPAIEEPRH
ncbi:MAG: acetoacetate decarboxylase family protein [Solirubrobacteraceae bacterium]